MAGPGIEPVTSLAHGSDALLTALRGLAESKFKSLRSPEKLPVTFEA